MSDLAHPRLGVLATAAPRRPQLLGRRRLHPFFRGWQAWLGIALLAAAALLAIFAAALAPDDPEAIDILNRLKPPSMMSGHLLGTDEVGRDLLSRLLYGGRISLFVGLTTIALGGIGGSALGVIAGYHGGRLDSLIMRVVDVQLAFPSLLLAIAILAVLGSSVANVILVLSIASWATFCRVARAQTLALRQTEFIEASRTIGASNAAILLRHIVPNIVGPLFVVASFGLAANILNEASLSFLGVGVPPTVPTWGGMLGTGREYLRLAWWVATFPGLALMATVFGINILGDRIRDYLDPLNPLGLTPDPERDERQPRQHRGRRMTEREPNQPYLIGFQVPNDDVGSITGYCAAQLAVDEANRSRTLPGPVALVPIIDRRDRDTARIAAAAFAAEPRAIGVLGPLNSDMALATQDIYHAAGLAQLTSEASSPLLTAGGYDNFFRLVANDEHQGRALAQVAVRLLRAERIAVLHDGSGWGKPIADIFAAEADRLGASPVICRGFGEREVRLDFDDLVAATMAAAPDLIYFAVYWNKAHIIAHRLRDAGSRATFLGSDALKPYAFLEVPSLDPVPPYHSLAGVDMRLKASARPFLERFATRFPLLLAAPQYAAEAYDCASLLLEAFRRADAGDRTRVLAALRGIAGYVGAIGPIAFDAHGDVVDPEIGLYQCQDGQRRYLGAIRDLIAHTGG